MANTKKALKSTHKKVEEINKPIKLSKDNEKTDTKFCVYLLPQT